MSDFGRKLYLIKMLFIELVSTFFMKIKLKVFQISYGSKCVFFGQTYIYKQKQSQIKLGNNLTFRSYPNSNLIGINRNCSLATLLPNAQLVIGNGCGFSGTVIGAFMAIELGENVMCGANTLITDSDWHLDDPRAGQPKPIKIGNNVWLGEGSKILKGVTIGENSIIGAGSVVVSNIPENVIAAGNPAKVIKTIMPK